MARQMLLFEADEVARNGALRKTLRPEVDPSAPCNTSASINIHSASFPDSPPPIIYIRLKGMQAECGEAHFWPLAFWIWLPVAKILLKL
jgi:hypothetical protein